MNDDKDCIADFESTSISAFSGTSGDDDSNNSSAFSGRSGDADCNDRSIDSKNDSKACIDILKQNASRISNQYALRIRKAGTGSGIVRSDPMGINCGSDCSESYNSGRVVTLIPIPDSNSIFSGWSGDADCKDGLITMNNNKLCTAIFNSIRMLYLA